MSIYDSLNPAQQEAVYHTEGALLVLAGAGSGKTRVLTHRIAYLIGEKDVRPWNIMAITFTNKAAGEMRERVDKLVPEGADAVWVATFHSSCVKILRRFAEHLGYSTSFTIYDSDDQRTLMKQILKRMDLDPKQYKERMMLNIVSSAKNELINPDEFLLNAGGDYREKKVGEIYKDYQTQLKKNNAMDFDDLIMKTVELFENCPDIRDYYQERFRYIMVDEYQDTNTAQFRLVALLADKYKNLCVVGDDDQSIYKFRGANIENILNFEHSFPGAKVIKLEQNYRSTSNILSAANEVIRHNRGRKDKTLWTANEDGPMVLFKQFDQAYEEADAIVRDILAAGRPYSECAVLYRTNAQSRLLEEKCIAHNVPYRLVGGVNFYQRKEIKDILSYLKTIANGQDDLAVQRIINVPKRGIGATTVGKIVAWSVDNDVNFYDACIHAQSVTGLGKAAAKIGVFTGQIETMRKRTEDATYSIRDMIEDVMELTGYRQELESEGEIESQTRMENVEELMNKAVSYAQEADEPTLDGFLEEVALVADIDRMDDSDNRVTLMTLHSAKGLEFPQVYLSGLEDGLFPSMMSITSDDRTEVEEERRLCYVGITRAMERLMMTASRMRMVNGETRYSKVSRFVEEIPEELLEKDRLEPRLGRKVNRDEYADDALPWNQEKVTGVSAFGSKTNSYASGTTDFSKSGVAGGGDSGSLASRLARGGAAGGRSGSGSTPGFGKAFAVAKASSLDYGAGDRVMHIKFGEGTVQDVKDGAKDYEVTVDFDRAGVKKMFASFAKLQKI